MTTLLEPTTTTSYDESDDYGSTTWTDHSDSTYVAMGYSATIFEAVANIPAYTGGTIAGLTFHFRASATGSDPQPLIFQLDRNHSGSRTLWSFGGSTEGGQSAILGGDPPIDWLIPNDGVIRDYSVNVDDAMLVESGWDTIADGGLGPDQVGGDLAGSTCRLYLWADNFRTHPPVPTGEIRVYEAWLAVTEAISPTSDESPCVATFSGNPFTVGDADNWTALIGPLDFDDGSPPTSSGSPIIYSGPGDWTGDDGNDILVFNDAGTAVFDTVVSPTSTILGVAVTMSFGVMPSGGCLAGVRLGDHDGTGGIAAVVSDAAIELRDDSDTILLTAPLPALFATFDLGFVVDLSTGYVALFRGGVKVGETSTMSLPSGTLYLSIQGCGTSGHATQFAAPGVWNCAPVAGGIIRNLVINPSAEQSFDRAWVASNGTIETNVIWEVTPSA